MKKGTELNIKKEKDKTKKKKVRRFNKRSFKYGSNSVILTVIVIALIIVINAIASMIPLKFDLTPNKIFSITDATKNVLKNLDMDVTIYALTDEAELENDSDGKKVAEILNHYKNDKVKVKYVDPDKNPSIIEEIAPDDVTDISKGDFVVKSEKRTKVIKKSDMYSTSFDYYYYTSKVTGINAEEELTSAIKFVTTDNVPVVYFTTGHDELDVDDNFGQIKSYLENNAFEVKTLNLLTEKKVPNDAALIIVGSPKSDLVLDEQVKLKEYLEQGKNAIFLFDPQTKNVDLKYFNAILNDYNINVNNDKIKETDSTKYVPGNEYMLIPDIPSTASSVIEDIDKLGGYLIMPEARSISILKNENDYLTVKTIAQTSSKAVSTPIAGGENSTGTFNLAVSAEYSNGERNTKILVTGNSVFASDALASYYGTTGLYFLAKFLNWMIDISSDTEIPIKEYESSIIDINQLQSQILSVIVVVVIPLIILVIGLIVWLRRRHL